jgi:hypothetical protein
MIPRHPERREGAPESGTIPLKWILHCVQDDVPRVLQN